MSRPRSPNNNGLRPNGPPHRDDGRWRDYTLYLLAGLAVLIFSGALLFSLQQLADSRAALYASRTTGSWVAFSLELEYRRLMNTLNRYGLGDDTTEHSELTNRFDIFWSRVPLLVDGPDADRLKEQPQVQALRSDLLAALEEVEPMVASLQRGDMTTYHRIRATLEPFSVRLRELFVTVEIDLKQTFRHEAIDSAYSRVFVSFVGVLLGGGAMVALLIVQMRRSARLSEAHRRARAAAVAASMAKSDFLARMTHELRTPLTAVIGYSEMLKEEVGERGYHDIEDDLERIRLAGNHLLSMINETLDLAKIETGRTELHPEQVDASKITGEILDAVQPLMRRNNNRLEIECADVGPVITDSTKLRQILLNLLSNAAKFTSNGSVHLSLRHEPGPLGGWLRYDIRDNGPGIPKNMQERIFEPFVQVDGSPTRVHDGTGLGLAIARSFCELMGGSVSIDSEPGIGTTFTVRLPADITGYGSYTLDLSEETANS